MAASILPSGSDLEMMSQTETEDTDSGEVSTESTSTSETTESTLDSSTSEDPTDGSPVKLSGTKPVNVSIDLTDVTALEDNESVSGQNSSDDTQLRQASYSNKNRKTGNEGKTSLANLDFSNDWYNNKCFSKYWQHYSEAMSWCRKHIHVYQNLMRKTSPTASCVFQQCGPFPQRCQSNLVYIPAWNHPYMCQQNNSINNSSSVKTNGSKRNHRRRRNAKHRKTKSVSSSEVTSSETQTETSEEFQMEITQDMIDFFAKTEAHRRERDEGRKAKNSEEHNESEHINVEDVKVTEMRKRTVEAPKERPGARRTAEMKLLYGKGAAMIHGMETALQMTYDRNTDLKQPKMWPNMPLRVVFR